jgi:hypothetical protein
MFLVLKGNGEDSESLTTFLRPEEKSASADMMK